MVWQGGLISPNSVGSLAVPKAIRTRGPDATLSVSLSYHGTGKQDHRTERGVELSRITVPRGTGIGREHVGWVSMGSGVSAMRGRRVVQGSVRSYLFISFLLIWNCEKRFILIAFITITILNTTLCLRRSSSTPLFRRVRQHNLNILRFIFNYFHYNIYYYNIIIWNLKKMQTFSAFLLTTFGPSS